MSYRLIIWQRGERCGLRRTCSDPLPLLLAAARRSLEAGAGRVRLEAADGSLVYDLIAAQAV